MLAKDQSRLIQLDWPIEHKCSLLANLTFNRFSHRQSPSQTIYHQQ